MLLDLNSSMVDIRFDLQIKMLSDYTRQKVEYPSARRHYTLTKPQHLCTKPRTAQ